jgi:ABC-type multidrug transport system fused ATPase/permease subunit
MIPPYISVLFRDKRLLLARYFATSIGRALASVLVVVLIQQFLAISHHSQGRFVRLLETTFSPGMVPAVLGALLVAVQLLGAVMGYDNRIAAQRATEILELGVLNQIIRNLLTLSVPFFKRQSEGDLIQTVRSDLNGLTTAANSYANLMRAVVMAVALTAAAVWLSPLLAFVALCLLPMIGIPLVASTSKKLREAARKARALSPSLYNAVLQLVSGIRIIKIYAAEEQQATITVDRGRYVFAFMMQMVRMYARMQVLLETIGGISLVAVITVGGYQLSRGRMTWDNLVAFVFATRSLFAPLSDIQTSYSSIQSSKPAVERVRALLDERPEVVDKPDAEPLPEAPKSIAFEDVGFGYSGATGPLVLKNLNFEIYSGETVGIVGPSGVGKSTMLNLIARFYDPTYGRVTFDGRDVRDFRLKDVYRHISIVMQDPFLFSASVWENIRCARPDASDEEVRMAAVAASIHDDLDALPDGYDTVIGPNGRELSRGQAQRVNVARALLRNSKLLILDEATASLDSIAEHEVQKSIERLMEGRTCFIVAHRLSTLRRANRLIVLDEGRCIAVGTHRELIRECPLYRTFWELQRLHDAEANDMESAPSGLLA